ncbi:hypothetical protein GQX74_005116 [Glossina fuscipes]|nr:hypothetical protein GQX74_005116 [Glossina fuscipes]
MDNKFADTYKKKNTVAKGIPNKDLLKELHQFRNDLADATCTMGSYISSNVSKAFHEIKHSPLIPELDLMLFSSDGLIDGGFQPDKESWTDKSGKRKENTVHGRTSPAFVDYVTRLTVITGRKELWRK